MKRTPKATGIGALEHHRARDVAEGQGILAVPHPEDGVELLGQLGRERRQDQGYKAGGQAEAFGGVLDGVHEEVGSGQDHPEARERLEQDGDRTAGSALRGRIRSLSGTSSRCSPEVSVRLT